MARKIGCVVALWGLTLGVALADEIQGVITQVEGGKVTFKKGAETKTYDLAKEVKVFRFVQKGQKELDPAGLKAEPLPNLPKAGVLAIINVTDGKITEITLPAKKKRN